MRVMSRRLLWGGLIFTLNVAALDFNNTVYTSYQRSFGDGSIVYVVPSQSAPTMAGTPGLTLTLDSSGSVMAFSASALTESDMANMDAAPSSYTLSLDDADGDGRQDLLLKNPAGRTLVIGTDSNGSAWVTSKQALSREQYRIGPNNVLVVYDVGNTAVSDPGALAEQYRVARAIPASNMLAVNVPALTGIAATAQSCSRNQILPLLASVQNAIAASGNAIRVILFIGDFPGVINDVYYDTAGHNIGFFDAFLSPVYFLTVSSGGAGNFSFASLNELYWKDNSANYPRPASPWHFNTIAGSLSNTTVNPPFNPAQRSGEGYAVFNIPLKLLPDPSLMWSKAISAEQANYSDWGSVILYGGSDRNPTSRHFLEEARYEGHGLDKFRWAYLHTTTETGQGIFPSSLADNDPTNATVMPGDILFSASSITDLFFISPGVRSYYDMTHSTETVGDYHYRNGAIAFFGQSFGATPSTTNYINANKRPDLIPLTAAPVQGSPAMTSALVLAKSDPATPPFAFLKFSYSGAGSDNAHLSVIPSAGTYVIVGSGSVGENFSMVVTQNNLRAFLQAVQAAVATTSRWSVTMAPGATQRIMSRAAAAIAAGATVAVGASTEPLSSGDPNTYALFTTLWYGGNLAEWQLRQRAGFRPDNNKGSNLSNWVEMPVGLVVYGDPLYAPFQWRAQRRSLSP